MGEEQVWGQLGFILILRCLETSKWRCQVGSWMYEMGVQEDVRTVDINWEVVSI